MLCFQYFQSALLLQKQDEVGQLLEGHPMGNQLIPRQVEQHVVVEHFWHCLVEMNHQDCSCYNSFQTMIDQCSIILFENMPDLIKIEWFNGNILKLRIML